MTDFLLPSEASGPDPRGASTDEDPGYVPGVEYDRWGRYRLPAPDGDPAELQYQHPGAGIGCNQCGPRHTSTRRMR